MKGTFAIAMLVLLASARVHGAGLLNLGGLNLNGLGLNGLNLGGLNLGNLLNLNGGLLNLDLGAILESTLGCRDKTIDVLIGVDLSLSVEELQELKVQLRNLAVGLRLGNSGVRIGIFAVGEVATSICGFTDNVDVIISAVASLQVNVNVVSPLNTLSNALQFAWGHGGFCSQACSSLSKLILVVKDTPVGSVMKRSLGQQTIVQELARRLQVDLKVEIIPVQLCGTGAVSWSLDAVLNVVASTTSQGVSTLVKCLDISLLNGLLDTVLGLVCGVVNILDGIL